MKLFLDIQGFGRFSDKFIVKELGVMYFQTNDGSNISMTRILFEPPCSWITLSKEHKNLNTYLSRYYHGIPWNTGETSYKDVEKIVKEVTRDTFYIYVKGLEKKLWIEKILNDNTKPVIDLEELGCPSLRILQHESEVVHWHGDIHGDVPGYRCAFENVQRLRSWYLKECTASCGKSFRIYTQVGCLKRMTKEDIAFLTKDFILTHASRTIDEVWEKLSEAMRKDEDIAGYRRCRRHSSDDDQIIPMIKDCRQCNLSQ